MSKMTDDDLLSFLSAEASSAFQYNSGQLASERERALKEYLRLPYGNEEDGHSSVVSSDVFDAVEGMLPDLVEIFASTDEAVRFEPVSAEDEEGANQASDACNYVFYKQNNGFLLLYTAAKDALMLKTGGVKWYWEEKRTPIFTTYKDVDEMSLALFLTTHPTAEVIEKEEISNELDETYDENMPEPPVGIRFNVKIKEVKEKGKVRIVSIPPDEFRVSKRHNSILLDESPYVAHVAKRTLSDIRQMGFEDVTLDDVKMAQDDGQRAVDADLRDTLYDGQLAWRQYNDTNLDLDPASFEGWLREEYVLVDYDGDGIAERRRIMRLGDKILSNEECSHVQMAAWTPYLLTHRFAGISVADLVSEFQRANTDIWRQTLDGLYNATNQETVVQTDMQGNPLANIDDLLNRKAGGIIREKTPGAVRPYVENFRLPDILPVVELMASAKENRTGYTRYSQGLDAQSLNKTAHGLQQIMNASQKRMKLMARIMAEALVAPMFKGIFKTLTDYCMDTLSFRMNNKFVQYDPQEWSDGYDMSINVGIGAGDKMQQMQMLGSIEAAQGNMMAAGLGMLVNPKNLYNLQKRKVELSGFKDATEFFTDPETAQPPQPPQPPPPDPKLQIEGAKLQQDAQKFQATQMQDGRQFMMEKQFEAAEAAKQRQHEANLKAMELQAQAIIARPPEPVEQGETQENQALMAMAQSVQMLAQAILSPKQIIKDEQGRPVGVAPVLQ